MASFGVIRRRPFRWALQNGLVLLTLGVCGAIPAAAQSAFRVTAEAASVYAEPDFDSRLLVTLEQGATGTVLQQQAEWHRVLVQGQQGFVHGALVEVLAAPAPTPQLSNVSGPPESQPAPETEEETSGTDGVAAASPAPGVRLQRRQRTSLGSYHYGVSALESVDESWTPALYVAVQPMFLDNFGFTFSSRIYAWKYISQHYLEEGIETTVPGIQASLTFDIPIRLSRNILAGVGAGGSYIFMLDMGEDVQVNGPPGGFSGVGRAFLAVDRKFGPMVSVYPRLFGDGPAMMVEVGLITSAFSL